MNHVARVVLLFLVCSSAIGSEFPTRPVRLLVPFPPGGGADAVARVIGQKLAEQMNQQVVIDNRGGAGGLIATELVSRAGPDGYTLLLPTQSTHGSNPNLYRSLPYDPVRSFEPVALLASVPNVLVVHPSVAAASVGELIALAKRKPGALNYASVGAGSSQQLIAELFKSKAGVDIVHVPYKGTGPALIDLMSGQVQMMFTNLITATPHIKTGKLKVLAVTSKRRSEVAADVPTVAETIPDFEVTSWYGLLAPAGTPKRVIQTLNRHVVAALGDSQVRARLTAGGADPEGGTPEAFALHIRSEIRKYADAVRVAGIKPE